MRAKRAFIPTATINGGNRSADTLERAVLYDDIFGIVYSVVVRFGIQFDDGARNIAEVGSGNLDPVVKRTLGCRYDRESLIHVEAGK